MKDSEEQKTIAKPVTCSGIGLHSGEEATVTFIPSEPDTGILFRRVDLKGSPDIPAGIEWVTGTDRATSIGREGAQVTIVEHILAAIYGLGIDNLIVELDSPEPPIRDGSSLPFVQLLESGQVKSQEKPKNYLKIRRPVQFSQDGVDIFALPYDTLRISFLIGYEHPLLRSQYASFRIDPQAFTEELAPARTYCFSDWAEEMRGKNLLKGGSLENCIVIGRDGILNSTPLRFQDEFVRHKAADLLGDLALLGRPLKGHILAIKSGHTKNISFVKKLKQEVAFEGNHGYIAD